MRDWHFFSNSKVQHVALKHDYAINGSHGTHTVMHV